MLYFLGEIIYNIQVGGVWLSLVRAHGWGP